MAGNSTKVMSEWEELSKLTAEEMIAIGVNEEDARNYVANLMSLYTFQTELEEAPSEENHGLPRNMTEEDRRKLDESYQMLINSTEKIRKQFRKTMENQSVEDKLMNIRSALVEDFQHISNIVAGKVNLPFSAAMFNSQKQYASGDLEAADTTGANSSTRIITTIRDEDGNERTGFFTKETLVTSPQPGEKWTTSQSINKGQLELDDGVRVDNRNSAMSAVAHLLGRGDLLAHSENITIGTGENKQQGTFMEFASGTDLDHCLPSDPYFQWNGEYAPSVKKDMMDLSIIDYLCLNVDRHGGNMFFRFGKNESGKGRQMTGLIGIDNDASFGTKLPKIGEGYNRLASLDNTVLISSSMARKLESITPDLLQSVLRNNGLNEDSVRAAADRLRGLQNMLEYGKEYSNTIKEAIISSQKKESDRTPEEKKKIDDVKEFLNDPIKTAHNKKIFGVSSAGSRRLGLAEVPDETLWLLNVKQLGDSVYQGGRTASGVYRNIDIERAKGRMQRNYNDAEKRSKAAKATTAKSALLQVTTENRQMFSKKIFQETDTFLKEAKAKTSLLRGTSKEFEDIRKTMVEISSLSNKFSQDGYIPSDTEMNLMAEYQQRLNKDCTAYLNRKQDEQKKSGKEPSNYAKERIELVQNIQKSSVAARNSFRTMGDAEMLKSGVKLAAQADEIRAFAEKMKNLDDKTANADNMKELAESLVAFSAKHAENKNMKPVLDIYAKKLNEQIASNGGFEKCKIEGPLKEKVEKLNLPRKQEAVQVKQSPVNAK